MPRPIRRQLADRLHARQRQQPTDTIRLQPTNRLVERITPMNIGRPLRILPLEPDDRNPQPAGHPGNCLPQPLGERMRRIDQKTDLLLPTKSRHCLPVERARNPLPMPASDDLRLAPRGIKIGRAGLVECLDRQPPLCRSAKDQDHGRKRCLNSCE